jgi:hypothetical protein
MLSNVVWIWVGWIPHDYFIVLGAEFAAVFAVNWLKRLELRSVERRRSGAPRSDKEVTPGNGPARQA